MTTISLVMIVKNEASILGRCLDSVVDIMDEIIVVDTGSTDNTKEIAKKYTNKIYDFQWIDDFSAARNFAFSKATCDFIYSADADEVIDKENQRQFLLLKEALDPDVEIVQMHYIEENGSTVLNVKNELRPKLFKRLRTFTWIDPIHETVRLDPVVFDSDICINHMPIGNHSGRDFAIFEKAYMKYGILSSNLITTYAKELLKCGTSDDLNVARNIFIDLENKVNLSDSLMCDIFCVMARVSRIKKDDSAFTKYTSKILATDPCSEVCYELGQYFFEKGDYNEASLWLYNAAFETQARLNILSQGTDTLNLLADCYDKLGDEDLSKEYRIAANEWRVPIE